MTGERFGSFEILEKLGEGGMGEVWKARDTRLNRIVALKVLPQDATNDDRRRRFLQEAQAASALNHPSIVTIHDIISDNGCQAITMEYIAGRTVDQLIPLKGLQLADVLRYGIAIASGVAAAHAAGIIHRDLKPGNVMVTESGQVKVLDFGLAKLGGVLSPGQDEATRTVAEHTAEGTIVGTVSYMSPEQAEGRPIDARSDIFSFGAMLYEMVTGQKAFRGDTRISTITSILRDEPKPISSEHPNVPRDLERIIARCLRKDAGRRYQTMTDVHLALEELKEDSESGSAVAFVPAPPKKRIPVWYLAGSVAVVIAAGGAWLLWGRTPAVPVAPLIIRPFTNYRGMETWPAVSADGKMIAFVWDGDQLGNSDIYVKLLDSSQPLQLTTGPDQKVGPIWSPDGRRIAYTSGLVAVDRYVYEIPALGGEPRRIAAGVAFDWSPDGNSLLVIRNESHGGMFLVSVADGSARRLTTFANGQLQDSARFSPDGTKIVFTTLESDRSRVMQLALKGGEPQPVEIPGLRQAIVRAFTPDGRELIIIGARDGGSQLSLFRVPIEGGTPSELPFGRSAMAFGIPTSVSMARLAPELAFSEVVVNINVWRVAAWPGAERKPERWITSTAREVSPAVSPDGSHIAVSSDRSGSSQIWLTDASGSSARLITALAGLTVGSPRWSPDGTQIAYDARVKGNPDIWLSPAAGGEPRQLTTADSEDIVPDWSPDGRWIYFTSNRTGRLEVWRIPATGGTEEQITREGGFNPHLSPDGVYIYYLKSRTEGELRRCPADGGKEQSIAAKFKGRNFVVLEDGIYGLDANTPSAYGQFSASGKAQFYRFRTGQWEDLGFVTAKPTFPFGISLSPDRKWLYYSQIDERGADIMLVDNFR